MRLAWAAVLLAALFVIGCGDNIHPGGETALVVTAAPNLETTEGGGTATFTVALDVAPLSDVNIEVASSNSGEGTVSPRTITLTAQNFNIPVTITVTGVDDQIDDDDQTYQVTLDAGATGNSSVTVTNVDNDGVGVVVAPTTGLQTTEGGGTATFTVMLSAQPTADVTIPVTSVDTTEGTVDPAQLVFTAGNWNAPQIVTVTGVDDAIADGSVSYMVALGTATSDDAEYNNFDPDDVMLTNIDNDSPGVTVSPTSGLITTEGGGTATFTVVLTAQPTADVTFGVSSSDPGEGTANVASLVFTTVNWDAPQTVTVTGKDDPLNDGDQAYTIVLAPAVSADPGYTGFDPPDVSVTNRDDENPGFVISPTSGLVTSETGGTDSFTVALLSAPTANVTIAVTTDDATEGSAAPAALVFTPANFGVPQTVTVTGNDDFVADGNQVYHAVLGPAVSADPAYDGLDPPDVTVSNTDNDSPGVTVTPTSGLLTSELGDKATFTIVLNSEPTANVTITLRSNDTSEGTVSPTSVTFTSLNWFMPRTITVTGRDDALADGNQVYKIVINPATSADPRYNGLDPPDVQVTNLDNDTAAVLVTADPLLPVSENGTTATFTMRLTTQPTANVTCTLDTSDATEGTVAPTSVTFTAANFATPQTITVTGVDDTIVDGAQLFFIITNNCTSTDNAYNNFNPIDVSCRNSDND
jgi:Calx-beta domain-containing protein